MSAPVLYTSSQAGSTPAIRARRSAVLLHALAYNYGVRVVGTVHAGGVLLHREVVPTGETWWRCIDNGGEFNLEIVNQPETHRAVPYTADRSRVDEGTMAYRIAMVLRDEPIDYDARFPDLANAAVIARA